MASEQQEQTGVRVSDKRGANHRPPPPVEEQPRVDQEELLRQHAARAAEDEQSNADAVPTFPEGTIFAQTAFLVYLRPDGVWEADTTMEGNVATQREAHRTDFLAGCAAIAGQVQSDSASDLAAAKVIAALQGMGEQMAASATAAAAQPGMPVNGNRAARRRRT